MIDANPTSPPSHGPEDERAKIRDDLIRRLFAVAISIGAASTIAQMSWVNLGRWPCKEEWQQLFVLVAAMTATVLSWDGYLFAIKERPLRNFWRFAIDIVLVFVYMVLLMTSKLLTWWLFIHALIYVLYALWDLLTIREWTKEYYYTDSPEQTVRGVYIGGLKNSSDVSRGPIITVIWGIYFWALWFLNDRIPNWLNLSGLTDRILGTVTFVVFGLYFYRRDKIKRYTMFQRLSIATSLLLVSAAYVTWFPTDAVLWNKVGPYIGRASCVP